MRKSYIGVPVGLVAGLLLVGIMAPSPKCGEVGYYPKLSAVCQAALHSEQYCSQAELADIRCAAATYAENRARQTAQTQRDLYERR